MSAGVEAPEGYEEDPRLPGFWFYRGLRIQADVEAHWFVADYLMRCLPRGARVLDVAAGQGALALRLLDSGYAVSATTWNDKCKLDIAQYRVDLDNPFTLADAGGRPYDAVCCIEIIEHLENPARFLRDCAALLAPNGLLILSTPNVESAQARLQWLVRGRPNIFGAEEIRTNRHIALLWREGLEHLIALAGYVIVERRLLGEPRLRRGAVAWAKRLCYAALHRLLGPETRGTTRVYVLRRGSELPRSQGADEVY